MGINILKVADRVWIPYEVIPLFAGAYVGYSSAHGLNTGMTGDIALYAPTAFAAGITPVAILFGRQIGKTKGLRLEEILTKEVILKNTGKNTLISAVATAVGYGLGYAVGSF
jgi:hypothetical protein